MALDFDSVPYTLEPKDILGPAVSILAACLSGWFLVKNFSMSRRIADRSIYVDGQKFLIEICNHLISDPLLWFIYNDCFLKKEDFPEVASPLFQAKLRAFAHLHLNMFEIVLNEAPAPALGRKKNPSNVWFNYFRDTLNRSDIIRAIFEEPESRKIWSPVLTREYGNWKRKHDPAREPKS